MFHWRTASGLNANIGYLIKGAVLLQIRDAANLSGLLHGELQSLDPLLNFAHLLTADGKGRPRCCQLISQRTLPVAGVAKKSTAFFIWPLKYDFSGTREVERRDFVFSTAHVWQRLFHFQNNLKNNVRTTSGQRDEIWQQLAWPLSPGKLHCSVTALPGILPESVKGKHMSVLSDVLFLQTQSSYTHLLQIWFSCYVMDVFQLGHIFSGRCQRLVQRRLHTSCLNNKTTFFFFFTRKFKIVRTLMFSFQEFSSILWQHIFIHLLKMYVDVEIVEHHKWQLSLCTIYNNTPAVRPSYSHCHLQVVNFRLSCDASICDSWGSGGKKWTLFDFMRGSVWHLKLNYTFCSCLFWRCTTGQWSCCLLEAHTLHLQVELTEPVHNQFYFIIIILTFRPKARLKTVRKLWRWTTASQRKSTAYHLFHGACYTFILYMTQWLHKFYIWSATCGEGQKFHLTFGTYDECVTMDSKQTRGTVNVAT